ncbi:hypothetical protein EYF80_047349 [Liparis tanakae]|uniref:Uncharacterized protein n=1 Tax=Liparis tanakae TaxID=230148 RepID=A0A4Z2FN70_9TELE|nr:hypothetical protein EYF80_047349 [Liparis tanakae]
MDLQRSRGRMISPSVRSPGGPSSELLMQLEEVLSPPRAVTHPLLPPCVKLYQRGRAVLTASAFKDTLLFIRLSVRAEEIQWELSFQLKPM